MLVIDSVHVTGSPAFTICADTALVDAAKSGRFWTWNEMVLVVADLGVSLKPMLARLVTVVPDGVDLATVACSSNTAGAAPGCSVAGSVHVTLRVAASKVPPLTTTSVSAVDSVSVTTTPEAGESPVLPASMRKVTMSPPWTKPPFTSVKLFLAVERLGAEVTANTVGSAVPGLTGSSLSTGAPKPSAVSDA